MTSALAKYWMFFKISFKQGLLNKPLLSGITFFLFILLFIYNRLWEVIGVQESRPGINSLYIWYLLFAEMIIISLPKVDRTLTDDVRSGTMAYYINKPVSFFLMRYCEALGAMTVSFLVMGLFGSVITLLFTGQPPFAWQHLPLIVVMCWLSSAINVLFFCGVGLCAVWLESTRTLGIALERLAFIFGGAIFPLSIYPEWFVSIARWTPFYSVYYLTIRLVYDFSWSNLAEALCLNLLWVGLIVGFVTIAYKKLNRKVDIYGG